MRRLAFAVPGDLKAPTGGYAYDRHLIAGLRALGWDVVHVPLPGAFPAPAEGDRAAALDRLQALPGGVPLMVDGLAFGAMDREAPILAGDRPLLALVHHPLARETGLPAARAAMLKASETAALAEVRRVVVTSPATAATLEADYGVAVDRIVIAVPGTEPAAFARGSGGPAVRILSIGTLIPRKGHLDLIAALARLTGLDWRLDIAGDARLDPAHARAVAEAIERAGFAGRVRLHGALPSGELAALHDGADLFVLASQYEGYGMAYAEALARGLPVVGTTGGAIPATVGGAGELVAPGDVDGLAAILALLIADPARRAALAAKARARASSLPRWEDTARRVSDAVIAAQEGS